MISGKGGTGKTSIVASFAALAERMVLADCDVDAANLHLVVGPWLKESRPFTGGKKARIDGELCVACASCMELCRFGAVSGGGPPNHTVLETFGIDPIACEGCGVCSRFCEAGAIVLEEANDGEWFVSETGRGPLVHARLAVAAGNSGKLVSLIRQKAREIATERDLDLVLVDGSPGIGCPVIASVTGSHLVLAVTEPSLSGLHDLERVAELARHFRVPLAVAINRFDQSEKMEREIESWCTGRDVPIAGRIPYSPEFTEAMIAGKSVVEYSGGPVSAAVRNLWKQTEKLLWNQEVE